MEQQKEIYDDLQGDRKSFKVSIPSNGKSVVR